MRFETFLLYAALMLGMITPIVCIKIKSEIIKRRIGYVLFLFITSFLLVDVFLMISYQLQSDFRFQYVYDHTSIDLKGIYKISALWAGQEGSFLLWSFIMAIMGIVVTRIRLDGIGKVTASYSVLFSMILILTVKSDPFQIAGTKMSDGLGLSKALQTSWMVVHPPLVFIGYSAMAVLLSLASEKNSNDKYIDNLESIKNKWVRVSFLFLGSGILTGSIWAYKALGWGGYWSWDPIENAALVPWLILLGYLHKKNRLSRMECMIPFILAGFGTFLARSGILQDKSVHSYTGGDESVLTFSIFGAFIILVIIVIIMNITIKRKDNKSIEIQIVRNHKEWFGMATYLYAALIFIGTIFPLLTNITTPIEYYNYISVTYVIINIFLLLRRHVEVLLKRFMIICIFNTLLILLILLMFHVESFWLLLLWMVFLPAFILCITIKVENLPYTIPHLAIILIFVGVIASSALSEKQVVMANISDNYIQIANFNIPLEQLQNRENVILSSLRQDIIIDSTQIKPINDKNILISYTTKPLIILFWIGGCSCILCSAFYRPFCYTENRK